MPNFSLNISIDDIRKIQEQLNDDFNASYSQNGTIDTKIIDFILRIDKRARTGNDNYLFAAAITLYDMSTYNFIVPHHNLLTQEYSSQKYNQRVHLLRTLAKYFLNIAILKNPSNIDAKNLLDIISQNNPMEIPIN